MAFFEQAITVLQTLVIALGAGLGIWGVINLWEGTTLFRTKDQKISIVGKSKLLDFPTMPTTAESFPLLISLFPYTLNLYLVNAIMSLFKL